MRPVATLHQHVQRIGADNLDARLHMTGDDELAHLGRGIDQMATDLKQHQGELIEAHRLASIGQVASGVAHEINSPLGIILGYVTLLRREAELIEDETRQSLAIVTGLLDLARRPSITAGSRFPQ